jgi:hypothetical protein
MGLVLYRFLRSGLDDGEEPAGDDDERADA